MTARYRVGIIGCGGIARSHLRGYGEIAGAEVVAGADPSPEARDRWAREYGVPRLYASAEELLERERPDLVSLCVWPPIRPELTELVCAHGVRGIVAEKPMAVDLAGCDRMIAAAERSGAVLIVRHQRRYSPRFVKAKALIDAGAIGQVEQVAVFNGGRGGGGDLITSSSHMVDVMRYLLDDAPAEWVIGQIDTRDPAFSNGPTGFQQWEETHTRYGHPIEAGALGVIRFRGGARGQVECGIVCRPRPSYSATIYGTDGVIETAGDPARAGSSRADTGEPPLRARLKGDAGWSLPEVGPEAGSPSPFTDLVRVLEQGGTHPLSMHSARQVHEILMAIYESARRRGRIDLPLSVAANPLVEILAATPP
jgi:predicted dehydrogenase